MVSVAEDAEMIPPEYWRQQTGFLPVLTSTYGTVGTAAASAGSLWNKSLKIKKGRNLVLLL